MAVKPPSPAAAGEGRGEGAHPPAEAGSHRQAGERIRTNSSGTDIKCVYTSEDIASMDYARDIGFPGELPFTRGPYPTMYRGRPWTIRMFSGFGSAADTNRRYHYLLEQGQTGLSVAFHLPTLLGYDSDDPRSKGEIGKCGAAIDSLADMETLLAGIPLDQVSTSMTINATAIVALCLYVAVAEKQGVPASKLRGTLQNDILKEYIAQKEWAFPIKPSLRVVVDMFEWCASSMPEWNTVSVSGYHIREAGSTAVQELAFTLIDGLTYVEEGVKRGLKVDEFAPRLSFFWDLHNDFFEEIAKMRAARRIWAREMIRRYNPRDSRSYTLRAHMQTAGVTLTAQQPLNNIARVALQALAGVLGGGQSMHTNSFDETYALPAENAVTVALRTQQILQIETGLTNTIDPFAGSYYLEKLTDQMEAGFYSYLERIEAMGGMVAAIEAGFPQMEIADAASRYQTLVDSHQQIIVGLNGYTTDEAEPAIPILEIDDSLEQQQVARLQELRASRGTNYKRALESVRKAAFGEANLVPPILDAVHAYATVGEIMDTLRDIFGEYRDPGYF
ncbi:MAG TPA: methylmalonyl-CoA mutase family protein [Chloroflexota bacterium]|nr:methylmalonyl-CoA mutase family protein [Chloroflexota bacterium]